MKKYDILLIDFPFEEIDDSKVRPALVISDNEIVPIGARITTQTQKYKGKNDYYIKDWKKAGLLSPSTVRLDKTCNFSKDAVIKSIGHLTNEDIKGVEMILNENLFESVEDFSNGAPLAGENSGVASILNALIKSEWDAVEDYNSAIASLSSTEEDYEEMINVLTDIVSEEHVHIGQLTEIMKLVSPNVEEQDKGREEANDQLEEPVKVEKEITEAKKSSDSAKIERAKKACLDALKNGSTQSEEIIQGVKWIYGISYDEAKKAFMDAHNEFRKSESLSEDYYFGPKEKKIDYLHRTKEGKISPLTTGETLELGDRVYDVKGEHILRVDSEPEALNSWSRRITFYDETADEHKTMEIGNKSLWEIAQEGDTAEEVPDDIDIEWHPASDLTEDKEEKELKPGKLMSHI